MKTITDSTAHHIYLKSIPSHTYILDPILSPAQSHSSSNSLLPHYHPTLCWVISIKQTYHYFFCHYFFYHQEALPPLFHFFAPFTTKFIKRHTCFQSLLQFSLEPTPPKLIMKVTNNLHITKSNVLISAFLLFGLSATSVPDVWFFIAFPTVQFFPLYGSSLHFQDITISWLSFHLTSYY